MSTLHFIDQQRSFYPVQRLCQVLDVVPSRYYASGWRKRPRPRGQSNRPGKRRW